MNYLRKRFPLNNLSSSYRINSKLHGKVHYHDSSDKFNYQNYLRLFKRVMALYYLLKQFPLNNLFKSFNHRNQKQSYSMKAIFSNRSFGRIVYRLAELLFLFIFNINFFTDRGGTTISQEIFKGFFKNLICRFPLWSSLCTFYFWSDQKTRWLTGGHF